MFRTTVGSHGALRVLAGRDWRGCQRSFLGLQKHAPLARIQKRLFSGGTQGRDPVDWESKIDLSPDDIDVIDKRTGESLLSWFGEASDGEEIEACGPVEWNEAFLEACASGDLEMVRTCLKDSPPNALLAAVDSESLRTSLHLAADHGHHEVISLLLEVGKDDPTFVESLDRRGCTPLQAAVLAGDSRCAEALQKAGAKLDVTIGLRRTLLHLAASEGHDEMMAWLIKAGLQLDSRTRLQLTPLHYAASGGHTLCLKIAVEGGANWGAVDGSGRTDLHMAAGAGHSDSVKFLLEVGLNPAIVDVRGRTASFHAAMEGHQSIAAYLVTKAKCGISATDEGRWTALHWAAFRGHLSVVKWLVDEVDVDTEAVDFDKKTPLHLAAQMGHLAIVEHLITAGGIENHEVQDRDGFTALHRAASGGHANIVQYLISKKAKLDLVAGSRHGQWTPLHLAVCSGDLETVKALVSVDGGCSVLEARIRYGRTALHEAAAKGNPEVVKLLLAKGSKLDSVAEGDGCTPLLIAAWEGHLDAVKGLVEAGCDIAARTPEGLSALGLAEEYEEDALVEYLKSQGCPE